MAWGPGEQGASESWGLELPLPRLSAQSPASMGLVGEALPGVGGQPGGPWHHPSIYSLTAPRPAPTPPTCPDLGIETGSGLRFLLSHAWKVPSVSSQQSWPLSFSRGRVG